MRTRAEINKARLINPGSTTIDNSLLLILEVLLDLRDLNERALELNEAATAALIAQVENERDAILKSSSVTGGQ